MKFLESTKGCRPGVLVHPVQTVSFCIHSLLAFHWHKSYTTFRAVEGWPETAMAVGAFLQVLARQQQYLDTYQSEVCFWADSNHIFPSWIYPAVGNGTLWSSSLKYEEKRGPPNFPSSKTPSPLCSLPMLGVRVLASCWCAAPKGAEQAKGTRGSPSVVVKHH